ncbi:helix-turn-helix transcriptional regulator [[Clostridium] scindens]|uniref:helix-turn-helix domain-containing protein n=1 Tax=Clostridium scindens (strain JCM 10418 / VPI 12708) TaxID=29347 RepID=UPI002FE6D36C
MYNIIIMKILLDKIMTEKNLSTRQVERMTGISSSSVGRIRNGDVSPTADTLEALAKGLNVRITDLIESPYK